MKNFITFLIFIVLCFLSHALMSQTYGSFQAEGNWHQTTEVEVDNGLLVRAELRTFLNNVLVMSTKVVPQTDTVPISIVNTVPEFDHTLTAWTTSEYREIFIVQSDSLSVHCVREYVAGTIADFSDMTDEGVVNLDVITPRGHELRVRVNKQRIAVILPDGQVVDAGGDLDDALFVALGMLDNTIGTYYLREEK